LGEESEDKAKKRSVVFVVGATASGKSDLALSMAKRHKGVIFNCDSIQIYSGLDRGSAKPTKKECLEVPHHLLNMIGPPNVMTTGDYRRAFEDEIKKIPIDQPVFLVGGTGFYFQAIENGLYPVAKASPKMRKQIEDELQQEDGAIKLYAELKKKDPFTALKISLNDHYRLVRALEIIRTENTTLTEIKKKFATEKAPPDFRLLKIGVVCQREELFVRIQKRSELMVQSGLRQEVQSFLDQGLGAWPPLASVGYAQAGQAIRENKSDLWLIEAISTGTRQLAKKQRTWFKRDPEIFWVEDEQSKLTAEKLLATFLQRRLDEP
ncbi:MAG: tRNA (adenosine(37)-N6)-dimethylallyltransferase MiaA, partial [Bdellovibrionota bacterium]